MRGGDASLCQINLVICYDSFRRIYHKSYRLWHAINANSRNTPMATPRATPILMTTSQPACTQQSVTSFSLSVKLVNKAIANIRLRLRCCSLAWWVTFALIRLHVSGHYVQTWRQPWKLKVQTHCIVVRKRPSHGHMNWRIHSEKNLFEFFSIWFKNPWNSYNQALVISYPSITTQYARFTYLAYYIETNRQNISMHPETISMRR